MKSYMLLAFTFTVAQAITHGLTGTPISHLRRSSGLVGQGIPSYYSQRYRLSGRPEYSETFRQESGNIYGGQRDGRYLSRNNRDSAQGLQYSMRPSGEMSSSRGQFGGLYNQQSRFQDGYRGDGYGYRAGRGQVSFNAPLANTRSYNAQFDAAGNQGYY